MTSLLQLRGWGVAFYGRIVLAEVHLELDGPGAHILVGPTGTGKSAMLRTLAGVNDAQPAHRTWGHATYGGRALGTGARPALVQQHARLLVSSVHENLVSGMPDRSALSKPDQEARIRAQLARLGLDSLGARLGEDVITLPLVEQRLVSILRAAFTNAPLLLVDEPTAGLPDQDARAIVALLAKLATERAVLVVTHNQQHARALGGTTWLLAGGRIVEHGPTEQFFTAPTTEAGRSFVTTGGCSTPSPMSTPEELAEGVEAPLPLSPLVRRIASESTGPSGFYWLEPYRLGGMSRPGLLGDLEDDLAALARLGVRVLVTLEERATVPAEVLRKWGIESVLFPIPDMHAPSFDQATSLCELIDRWHASGEAVAVHCLAGLGRTGTVLAAHLIWHGKSALEAVESVRAIRPRAIQSEAQAEFLSRFAETRRRGDDAISEA